MTASLAARALDPALRPRIARRHRFGGLVAAAAVIVAGVGWPGTGREATGGPVVAAPAAAGAQPDAARRAELTPRDEVPTRSGDEARRPRPSPRPLAPLAPPDGRDAPDPFVLADGDRYVLYSTQVGFLNVPVATSPDLRRWSHPGDALPELPTWAEWGRTWAPGVMRHGGRYVLFFTARDRASGRQCIGVATSAVADGPFDPLDAAPLVCQTGLGGSIDPHPFVDADGTAILLWKADGNAIGLPSTLFAQPLAADGVTLAGDPVALLTSGAPWEQPLVENPALIESGGGYLLLYSGGWWESAGYAIGYARCDTPIGPCAKVTVDGPLLATGGGDAGPGGACVVTGSAGDTWLAYHAWTPGAVGYAGGGARSLRFASLTLDGGRVAIAR